MLQFLNSEILDEHLSKKFPSDKVATQLGKSVSKLYQEQISVIFVDRTTIKDLNREFRQKDQETDVLSFEPTFQNMEFSKRLNSKNPEASLSPAEIYICPTYILDALNSQLEQVSEKRFLEEIYRMIIHGILHLAGRDHSTHLDYDRISKDIEPMFDEQERLLNEFLRSIPR